MDNIYNELSECYEVHNEIIEDCKNRIKSATETYEYQNKVYSEQINIFLNEIFGKSVVDIPNLVTIIIFKPFHKYSINIFIYQKNMRISLYKQPDIEDIKTILLGGLQNHHFILKDEVEVNNKIYYITPGINYVECQIKYIIEKSDYDKLFQD